MIPAAFGYDRPSSLDEAIGLLARDGDAKILAGGQSLLPLLKLRLAAADRLIDIGRIRELRGIRELADGGLAIGALTTYRDVLDSPAAMRYRCLAEAVPDIGDVQVRNRGTVGGSIAHADPASDLPAVVLALGATVVARSSSGERTIPANEFFQGPFQTALRDDEILTEIRLPGASDTVGSAYRSLTQLASGYSIVGVAAVVARSGGSISMAQIGITGVGDVAYRATAVEQALSGTDGSAKAVESAAAHAAEGQTVASDIHADGEYRARMAQVFVRRAVEGALAALG
jgi:aerobic carbon-monoxide dehydrogenase medium subunit